MAQKPLIWTRVGKSYEGPREEDASGSHSPSLRIFGRRNISYTLEDAGLTMTLDKKANNMGVEVHTSNPPSPETVVNNYARTEKARLMASTGLPDHMKTALLEMLDRLDSGDYLLDKGEGEDLAEDRSTHRRRRDDNCLEGELVHS